MVVHSHGPRARTRRKLKKGIRERGLIPITRLLKKFEIGDKVIIKIEPSVHKGMPHPRFHGRVGEIIGRRGRAYIVRIKDAGREKLVISYPVHLQKL